MATKRTRESRETKDAFLHAYRELGSIGKACKQIYIGSRQTIHDWMAKDPVFQAQVEAIKDMVVDDLEARLHAIAMGRAQATSPQVTALIFSLKGNRPEKYRDRYGVELTGKDGGAVEVKTIEIVKSYGSQGDGASVS